MLTFKEMAVRMKNSVIREFPAKYAIAEELKQGLSDADIQNGVKAFSELLIQLLDVLEKNPDADETLDRSKVKTIIHTDIRSALVMLYGIGLSSRYDNNLDNLIVDGGVLNKFTERIIAAILNGI